MTNNYDTIATNYDLIRKIVLGNSIVSAQVCLLKYIPADSRVLIVGGGTGWIIEEIAAIHPEGLKIDYVESSAKMIGLSKKKDHRSNNINFIHQAIENYSPEENYDVIITPFLFDNFQIGKIEVIYTKLNAFLKNDGIWLYADFVYDEKNGRLWQKILLRMMYLFFRITCNIETQELVAMDTFFDPLYHKIFEASFYHHFIRSIAYRKQVS
jgi:ubiquinone/menaquinone biosynthesis C-methylase UbiE